MKFFLRKLYLVPRVIVFGVLVATLFAALVPLKPRMPATGLDSSWEYGMNQAVANRIPFGKAFVFTFGPYASIQSNMYHPATDHLMILGSLYLALCYAAGLVFLGKTARLRWLLIFAAFLAGGFMPVLDALLLSYALIVAGAVYRATLDDDQAIPSRSTRLALLILVSPLGLLPLVKGTLLALCGAVVALCCAILWKRHDKQLAYCCALVPLAVALLAWSLAGQPLLAFGYYVLRLRPVISGYSEAMALPGNSIEVVVYLFAAAVILYVAGTTPKISRSSRLFLSSSFLVFLFIMFKDGFVRHDFHSYVAGTGLVMAALILILILQNSASTAALLVALTALFYLDQGYGASSTSTRIYYDRVRATYSGAIEGLRLRSARGNELERVFEEQRRAIAAQYRIPLLKGTTDIYPTDQAALLASDNNWSPRPVLQSYMAYTPELARLDERHLVGASAPDNVVFRVYSLDGRFPALDDGPSWVPLLSRYSCTGIAGDFLYLTKASLPSLGSVLLPVSEETHSIDQDFDLPLSTQPLFAQIDIHPTFLGRIASSLYKAPALTIHVRTAGGLSKTYTLISGMAKAGFVISPFVESTREFALLFGDSDNWKDSQVISVRIDTAGGKPRMWRRKYTVRLSGIQLRPVGPSADEQNLGPSQTAACGTLEK